MGKLKTILGVLAGIVCLSFLGLMYLGAFSEPAWSEYVECVVMYHKYIAPWEETKAREDGPNFFETVRHQEEFHLICRGQEYNHPGKVRDVRTTSQGYHSHNDGSKVFVPVEDWANSPNK